MTKTIIMERNKSRKVFMVPPFNRLILSKSKNDFVRLPQATALGGLDQNTGEQPTPYFPQKGGVKIIG